MLTPPPLPSPVPTPPPLPPRETPSVVTLFRLYCTVMVLLLSLGAGYAYLVLSGTVAPSLGILESIAAAQDPALREELIAKEMGRARTFLGIAAVGIPASILGGLIPRKPWGHAYGGLMLMCSSLLCVTLPVTIPMFIYWQKPETRLHFGSG